MKHFTPHNAPEFKGARKAFQGINATQEGSIDKSIRRHKDKHIGSKAKALSKQKYPNTFTSKRQEDIAGGYKPYK